MYTQRPGEDTEFECRLLWSRSFALSDVGKICSHADSSIFDFSIQQKLVQNTLNIESVVIDIIDIMRVPCTLFFLMFA